MFRLALLVVASLVFAGVADAQPSNTSASVSKSKSKSKSKSSKRTSKTKTSAKKTAKKSSAKKSSAKKSAKKSSAKKTSVKSRTAKATSRKRGKRGKRGKREARVPWKPTRRTLANTKNLPSGFSWPPTRTMHEAEQDCESKLDRAGVVWEHADGEGRIADPIVVPAMTFGGVKYTNMWGSKGPHRLDCQLALALETVGPELYALGVREVKFGSLYRWSNVRSGGVTKPYLSRHGLGIAMDIGSFVDDTGREAVVERDYKKGDGLLHGIEQLINANGNFRILLTPKNDPISHHNHYHLEAKADYTAPDLK